MEIKQAEQKIFNVVWESNVDGEIFYEFYPCDTIEVARAKMTECTKLKAIFSMLTLKTAQSKVVKTDISLWTRPMIIGKIFISKNQGCLLKTILEKIKKSC